MKSLALSLLLGSIPLFAQSAQNVEAHHQPQTVKLDPGSCPEIHEGDTIQANLKPGFIPSDVVANSFQLTFFKDDVPHDVYAVGGPYTEKSMVLTGNATKKLDNGFWKVYFSVTKFGLFDGKYTLRMLFATAGGTERQQTATNTLNSVKKPELLQYCVNLQEGYQPPAPTKPNGFEIEPAR